MNNTLKDSRTFHFLKSLGFPDVEVHNPLTHFDFTRKARRILVIGPMGSGKTEYSSKVWRDSLVAQKKSALVGKITTTGAADRRKVFFIRSRLDVARFPDYPEDALAYRGGYERCGKYIAHVRDSFELEAIIEKNPGVGTWIIDEASFYDERLVYVIRNESEKRGLIFIFPTLILNFRKDIFNSTARLLLEHATDVIPLTAYCEHEDCLLDSFYTYRYYLIDGEECPALYFDPLIIIGGDTEKEDPREPNYCTRCDDHHFLPGKEYTYLVLKPLGELASKGNIRPLEEELRNIKFEQNKSKLYKKFSELYSKQEGGMVNMNALKVPCIAEKAVVFLFVEQNLVSRKQLIYLVDKLKLDVEYLSKSLSDNGRQIEFTMELF